MQLPEYVYHLAEEANWSAIEEHGLLPAEVLISNALSAEPSGLSLKRAQRTKHTVLPTGVHIRDQKPMPPKALASCLVGLTPPDWYALINAHVFFWFDPERLNRQRAACGTRPQIVAIVRTAELLEQFAQVTFLTPFNIGYALRRPARRCEATLVQYSVWSSSGWLTETQATGCRPRSRKHRPAELLVRGPVPRFECFVQSVVKLPAGKLFAPNAA
jgi:hypothetical protein